MACPCIPESVLLNNKFFILILNYIKLKYVCVCVCNLCIQKESVPNFSITILVQFSTKIFKVRSFYSFFFCWNSFLRLANICSLNMGALNFLWSVQDWGQWGKTMNIFEVNPSFTGYSVIKFFYWVKFWNL